MHRTYSSWMMYASLCTALLCMSFPSLAQSSYQNQLQSGIKALLARYPENDLVVRYAQSALKRFEAGQAPATPLKQHIGIAIVLSDSMCLPASEPSCDQALAYPAVLMPQGDDIFVQALRQRSDKRPPSEQVSNSYTQQFLNEKFMGLGRTPEFKFLTEATPPRERYANILSRQPQEWWLNDLSTGSVVALRQQGLWLLAVSSDAKGLNRRMMIYVFPTELSMQDADKMLPPASK